MEVKPPQLQNPLSEFPKL